MQQAPEATGWSQRMLRYLDQAGLYEVPVPDFRLVTFDVESSAPVGLDDAGPSIVLCTSGAVQVGTVAVTAGRAAFVPAADTCAISGHGKVFVAGVGAGPGPNWVMLRRSCADRPRSR